MSATVHRVFIPLFLFSLLFTGPLLPGAWTQKRGGYYLEIGANYSQTRSEFNFRGDKRNILADFSFYQNTSYSEYRLDLYAEYGLQDYVTLVGYLPLKHAVDKRRIEGVGYLNNSDRVTTSSGPGDTILGTRLRLWNYGIAIAVESAFKLPIGYSTSAQDEGPALGSGEVDWQNLFWLGTSLQTIPLYSTGYIGYRRRGGALNDEVLYHAEIGYVPGPFTVKFAINGVKNTGTLIDIYGQEIITPLPGGGGEVPVRIFGDQDFTKLNLDIIWQLNPTTGLKLKTFHTPFGKNIIAESTIAVAIVLTN